MKIRTARKLEKLFSCPNDKRIFDGNCDPKFGDKRFKRLAHLYSKAVVHLNKSLHFGRFLNGGNKYYNEDKIS